MSDEIKHECGVTLLRLRQGLGYYERQYGSAYYGFEKLALLMEKQHNRGQDGAGIGCVGLQVEPGHPFYQVEKSCGELPLAEVLNRIGDLIAAAGGAGVLPVASPALGASVGSSAGRSLTRPFCGEVYLGHVRYGTYGNRSLTACHPQVRDSSWRNHCLLLAGNFNLTNTRQLFTQLVESGHHPSRTQDSEVLLVQLVHYLEKLSVTHQGTDSSDILGILSSAARHWDGGFVICGALGNGDAFALRDAAGIRPAFYYFDDEIAVVASERAAIQTAFNLASAQVQELPPGHALSVMRNGELKLQRCLPERPLRRCVFERIYFSRGSDADIQRERRALGRAVTPAVLAAVDHDYANTVFSYIPNTAQISFHGMLDELHESSGGQRVRFAQIAVKDAKFRTFIADAAQRKDLFPHVYDVTYGIVRQGIDNLVVIDDSIVRGNTMRNAILPILDRLGPKRIVVVSSAPPICYPDCYGIDMASFGELVAFEALMSLIKRRGLEKAFQDAVALARADLALPDEQMANRALALYALVTPAELSAEICRLLRPPELKAELRIVYQSCEQLRACCPDHLGDWYFTGDYPTAGGKRVVNCALVNYASRVAGRAY